MFWEAKKLFNTDPVLHYGRIGGEAVYLLTDNRSSYLSAGDMMRSQVVPEPTGQGREQP